VKISVIIPCHNAGPWIVETLRSISTQVFPPHEVIVIDDASSDDSLERVRSSGVDVRVLQVNVRNAAAARNEGIRVATGDWIAFLDADDIWLPGHLMQASALLGDSDNVAYMANHLWLREGGVTEPIPPSVQPKIDRSQRDLSHLRFVELCAQGFHFGHSTVLLKLDRVREVGAFDESQKRRHDMDLWLRVLQGRRWAWGQSIAALYRIDTPGSISKSVINAEYFFLRALIRNASGYPHEAMQQLIRVSAQRSMSLALADGTPEDFRLARSIAWPYIPATHRMWYRVFSAVPSLLRRLIHLKRRLFVRPSTNR